MVLLTHNEKVIPHPPVSASSFDQSMSHAKESTDGAGHITAQMIRSHLPWGVSDIVL
jgi:hypothetical protein